MLQGERRELERTRQHLFLDRAAFKKSIRSVQEGLRLASLTGGEEGARMVHAIGRSAGMERLAFEGGGGGGGVAPSAGAAVLAEGGGAKGYDN